MSLMRLQRVGLGLAVSALALCACGEQETGISVVSLVAPDRLALTVQSCGQEPRVEVEEHADEVRLRVTVDEVEQENGQDCADTVEVQLKSPLGPRAVIDERDGDRLPVSRLP